MSPYATPSFESRVHSSGKKHPCCYTDNRGAASSLKLMFIPKSGLASSNMGEGAGTKLVQGAHDRNSGIRDVNQTERAICWRREVFSFEIGTNATGSPRESQGEGPEGGGLATVRRRGVLG